MKADGDKGQKKQKSRFLMTNLNFKLKMLFSWNTLWARQRSHIFKLRQTTCMNPVVLFDRFPAEWSHFLIIQKFLSVSYLIISSG